MVRYRDPLFLTVAVDRQQVHTQVDTHPQTLSATEVMARYIQCAVINGMILALEGKAVATWPVTTQIDLVHCDSDDSKQIRTYPLYWGENQFAIEKADSAGTWHIRIRSPTLVATSEAFRLPADQRYVYCLLDLERGLTADREVQPGVVGSEP